MDTLTILKDEAKKQLNITRLFNAPVEKVWRAWTESELLDEWWGPKPWKAIASQDLCSAGFVDRYRLKVNCRTAANALQVFEGQACRGQGSRGAGAVRRFHKVLLRMGRH